MVFDNNTIHISVFNKIRKKKNNAIYIRPSISCLNIAKALFSMDKQI